MSDAPIKAVLGPTNTGKTHLAIERMCAHSSGMIGFPLRLLAREVYDRVVAIKGAKQVALITGEERIEPPNARYFLCTAEAMDRTGGGHAFVALDEAQLAADPERGHIFTDRLLNARGREETMLLGAATLEPVLRQLEPDAEITERPRFSTLTHIGPRKLSRLPPRSAIVAFSSEGVYRAAEMLRRYRGGAAVVMGALSPETRNKQVELFQSGEVDYIVATDAIGMGLNLDLNHVAFAALTKFDGMRKRRLIPAEMAQIAGRAGRHQRDGTFGVLSGAGNRGGKGPGVPVEFDEEEIYAIEENRFAPLTQLYWRNAEPRFDTLPVLIGDLEGRPMERALRGAPESIDLTVLKKLAEEPLADSIRGAGEIRRFWEACTLPDFRQAGADQHARFVARLWRDLRGGYIGADFVAARIAELDQVQGDIATLQGKIASIRSWAYICQRPDWVLARDEMAARARAVEARLSDALHARLTERFVNRRTAILMKNMGEDPNLLPVTLDDDGTLRVEDEAIGRIEGFRFTVDTGANHEDRRMLLAAGEKALPRILGALSAALRASDFEGVELVRGEICMGGQLIATLEPTADPAKPRLAIARELDVLLDAERTLFDAALQAWAEKRLAPLEGLSKLVAATRDPEAGSQARALLLALVEGHGYAAREHAGIEHLPKEMRPFLRRLGVTFGALDIFARDLLKPAPREAMHAAGIDGRALEPAMRAVLPGEGKLPSGYRPAGSQYVRIDVAEKILRAAHDARAKATDPKAAGRKGVALLPALAVSTGLTLDSWQRLLGAAGFRQHKAKVLAEGVSGPPALDQWTWRPGGRPGGAPQRGRKPQDAKGRNQGGARNKPRGKPSGKPSDKRPAKRSENGSNKRPDSRKPSNPAAPATGKAFAGLADLMKS